MQLNKGEVAYTLSYSAKLGLGVPGDGLTHTTVVTMTPHGSYVRFPLVFAAGCALLVPYPLTKTGFVLKPIMCIISFARDLLLSSGMYTEY